VQQSFHWVNDIEYRYGINSRKKMFLNLVVCEETVYVKNKDTGKLEISEKKRYAWLSSKRLTQRNVSGRCNSIGRSRWNIETQNLVEKHHGYAYQHCFSYDWNAMRCFHYIMHIGHIVNVFTMHFKKLRRIVKEKGVRGTVEFILLIFSGCPLDAGRIKEKVNKRYQYRFEI